MREARTIDLTALRMQIEQALCELRHLGEAAGRHRFSRPWHFFKHRSIEFSAEPQRLFGDDDGSCRHRLLVRLEILRLHAGLVVEPDLGDEYREQAEHDGKPNHDNGAGTQGFLPRLTRPELLWSIRSPRLEVRKYSIAKIAAASGAMLKGFSIPIVYSRYPKSSGL